MTASKWIDNHRNGATLPDDYLRALDALDSILKIHNPEVDPRGITVCDDCFWHTGEQMEWPCPAVQAIRTALGVDVAE